MILALETSTSACSVAVADPGGRLLAETLAPAGPAHTRRLLSDVHHALDMAGTRIEHVRTVLVGIGPGTFTGLRIGLATARALAQAGDARLVGVPSLASLAWALAEGDAAASVSFLVPLIDGKRGEVFAACYSRSARCAAHNATAVGATGPSLDVVRPLVVVKASELQTFLRSWPNAIVGGDGAHLYAAELPASAKLARAVAAPTAAMALRAWRAGVPGAAEGFASATPIYGRAPDAARWTGKAG